MLLGSLLPLLSLLQGCVATRLSPGQTLHVVVASNNNLDWLRRDYIDSQAWETLLSGFRRLQPGVTVEISVEPEERITAKLAESHSRGLSPDLLLLRAPAANAMLQRRLVDPLPRQQPGLGQTLSMVTPQLLERVQTRLGYSGLPVFTEFTVACYDRRRVPQPPATLDDLLRLAASGQPVGLGMDPPGLWWTVGATGAQDALVPLVIGKPLPAGNGQYRAALSAWLTWLRQAALQSRVDMASDSHELTEALETGQLAWIPCFSMVLRRLDRSLGPNLGVAPLPSGPGGSPSPYSVTRVWSLGRDSSPQQRKLAMQLALLSLDPLVQRDLARSSRMVVPANRMVPLPVSTSSRLQALAEAQRQFDQASPMLASPFSLDRLQWVTPYILSTVAMVMVGAITPDQGSEQLLRLNPKRK
ncbi:MAG: extracellular solute-binding protein [Synechococcaceae cyanobacterium]|nr:extracellular solute-binding protein [Synechococcaceae cyanobacterium]